MRRVIARAVAGLMGLALLGSPAGAQPPSPPRTPQARAETTRLEAVSERILSVSTCGHQFRGGDARGAHGFIESGDAWLSRGDRRWEAALRTGDRYAFDVAHRLYEYALRAYRDARTLGPRLRDDEPGVRPGPFPEGYLSEWHTEEYSRGPRREVEPEVWGPWNRTPVE